MTNKEAKHILELYASLIEIGLPDDKITLFRHAYELAIQALERDGTMTFEDDEPTVCTCPVCGSIWKIVETNKSGTWN